MELSEPGTFLAFAAFFISVTLTLRWHSEDICSALRYVLTGWRVRILLACLVIGGTGYGAVRWYRSLGCARETHAVDEYQFKFTTERDRDWGHAEGNDDIRDDIYVSVHRSGVLISGSNWVGAVMDPDPKRMHFSARRLPNESLIILTRTDYETEVVFAFDTANGECYPWHPEGYCDQEKHFKAWIERREQWEARMRASLGDQRYAFACALSLRQ